MKIRQNIILFSIIILAGNAFVGYGVYKSNQRILSSDLWVQHTEKVIYELGNIHSVSKDIQIAALTFSITNDSLYLRPYLNSTPESSPLGKLTFLTRDNPKQQAGLIKLNQNMKAYLAYSLDLALKRKSEKSAFTAADSGINYIAKINAVTEEILQEENRLLQDRRLKSAKSMDVFSRFAISMFVLMVVFTILFLIIAANYLLQNKKKETRAAELVVANIELDFQNKEKEKRAAELIIANKELAYQNQEKEKRAAELILANEELEFQNDEKENRASELAIANKELAYQNKEKENRAAELIIANYELAFQNNEKENRAAELIIANYELAFQYREKENRAAELVVANLELAYQNREKEKRAAELDIANRELAFQNKEKEKRAAELDIANHELVLENQNKEKKAAELIAANKNLKISEERQKNHIYGLEKLIFITSHRVRQPIANIIGLSGLLGHSATADEEKEVAEGLRQSADYLNDYTKELTILMHDMQQNGNLNQT